MYIIKMLINELRNVADKLESNTCEIGEQEAIDIINIIAREPMSKQSAAEFMNMSIPTSIKEYQAKQSTVGHRTLEKIRKLNETE